MAAILKIWNLKHSFTLTSDMKRSFQIMPKKFSRWWRLRWRHMVASKFPLYSCLWEVGSGPDATFCGLFGWLFNWKSKFSCRIISNIANYLKYNYFWESDGIDNVTLQLWKFSDFYSGQCRRRGWWYHNPHISFSHLFVTLVQCILHILHDKWFELFSFVEQYSSKCFFPLGPSLLTLVNFNHNMAKKSHGR